MTEKCTCLGQEQNPILLKWAHNACQESWFVPEWEAHEAAVELSWQLGSSCSSCPPEAKLSKSICGSDRHVQFSDFVDVCICSSSAPIHISFKTPENFLTQWPGKPWRIKPCLNESSGTSLEPLSTEAVSIRKDHQELPTDQFRTTDAFHNALPTRFSEAEEMQETDEDDTQFFLHEEPESVQILFDALLREGLIIGPSLTESVFLRTWHIHHFRELRCWHPRIIELNGHWRTWFADVVSGWRDKNDPTEETIFSIVYPNPPRNNVRHEIMFDLIIAQGLEAPRKASLVTVLQRDDVNARVRFALAASVPDQLSGFQVVQSAEVIHECNLHLCTIRHGLMTIPFSMMPTHIMQDGDSFTVAVRTRTDGAAASSSHDFPAASVAGSNLSMHSNSNGSSVDPDASEPSSAQAEDTTSQGVHIFRLGHMQTFGRLRWDTAEHILQDAARTVRLPVAQFVCFHYLQVHPDDMDIQQEAIILQHVHDVAPGSTEKLILIDVEMHTSGTSSHALHAPRVMRQVFKVVPTLTRSQVLQIAHALAYCEWAAQGCFVFCNRIIWNAQDLGPRRIAHGMYFRIIIPPPANPTWEIGHALRVFEEAADLFELPESHRIAVEILNNNPQGNVHIAPAANDGASNTQCKGADLGPYDIDVPITNPPREYRRRLRPEHDGTIEWLLDLGHIFGQDAEEEAFAEEPMLYVQTWFVNHRHHTSCRRPRPLRLDRYSVTWIDDFRRLWADVLQRNEVFSLRVVRPRPPQARLSNYACHVIVEQSVCPQKAACVVTALFEGGHTDGFIQGAFSLPSVVREQDVIDAVEIEPFCEGRSRTITCGQVPIHLIEATDIQSGCSIKVRITAPQSQQQPIPPGDAQDHFEDVAMIQKTPARTLELDSLVSSCFTDCVVHVSGGNSSKQRNQDFEFNVGAAEFRPGAWNIRAQPEHIQDLYAQWAQRAWAWEGETAMSNVITWFVDHRNEWHCYQGRVVALYEDFEDWERRMRHTWQDKIDPTSTLEFNVVSPLPPRLEHNVAAHVILIQAPGDTLVTSLVTASDPAIYGPEPRRAAITTHEHIRVEHLLPPCNYDPNCLYPGSQVQCQVWYDRINLLPGMPIPGRSGYSILILVNRLPIPIMHMTAQSNFHDENVQLQLSAKSRERTSSDTESRDIESVDVSEVWVPISLIDGGDVIDIPQQIFLPDPVRAEDVESELAQLGWIRHVYILQSTGFAFCIPLNWQCDAGATCYVYHPISSCDRSEIILHQDTRTATDMTHMQFLHSLGFCRAVIVSQLTVRSGLILIQYHNNQPELEQRSEQIRCKTPWPKRMPTFPCQPFFDEKIVPTNIPAHRLEFGANLDDLKTFFQSSDDVLCRWHSHLDMPEVTRQAMAHTASTEERQCSIEDFDRLVIYTDGSSKSQNRRKPPLRVQEQDVPDAWAFLVLGEKYTSDTEELDLTLLGWHAQCVTYEEQLTHFLGTTQIGSEHSEREALFWAALWRMSVNLTIPTVFRSDSVTTAEQSVGAAGCHDDHPTFNHLRSIFQALQAALPPDCLEVQHVRGHAGDPWNELVDHLAKTEATIGHKLRRQTIDLSKWKPVLPFLWMIFERHAGLPQFRGDCFDVKPPCLPPESPVGLPTTGKGSKIIRHHMALSLASCNVGSLFVGPDGYGGKLAYLRTQMKSLRINMLGIQEARSPSGMTVTDEVVRLASGCEHGQHGVELWVNTIQPIAHNGSKPCFIKKTNLQVVHSDPRRLVVRLAHPCLDCHACVFHAPQSGRPLQERRQWWEETGSILRLYAGEHSMYVLLDANAKTGPSTVPIVFEKDDVSSANTGFLREFLFERNLCLPSTSSVHQGSDCTWTAPDGIGQHRIDFVAIPQDEMCYCTHSCTIEHFDTGNGQDDHQAVALQLQWVQDRRIAMNHASQVHQFDRHAIAGRRAQIELSHLEVSQWNEDIETHVQSFNAAIHQTVQKTCPIRRQGKKKHFITDEIWAWRSAKLHLRRRLQEARRQISQDSLRLVFWAWKQQQRPCDGSEYTLAAHARHTNTITCNLFHLNCRYQVLTRKIKRALQNVKQVQLATELDSTSDQTAAGTLLQILKPFIGSTNPKKHKKTGLPAVRQKDGSICKTPEEAQDRWIEYFGQMEGGRRLSTADYRSVWRENLHKFLHQEAFAIDITELPSLVELESAFRRVSAGKAVGQDGIPPELCKVKATELAKLTYTMLMKVFIHGQEAAEHKGGRLAIAWKNRGDTRDCDTHRSLLVSSHIGKTLHRALRQKHHSLYTAYMQGQQLGGRPKIPVGIPLHLSRAFLRWQRRLKRPTACVFLDLTEAFYRLVRPLALGGDLSDEDIAAIAAKLGFDADTLHQFHAQLQEPSAVQQAGASPVVQRFLQALHSDTWFTLGTQTDVVRTAIGSRPGDSYADVVFGLLWAKLLRQYEQLLTDHGVLEQIPVYELPHLFDHSALPTHSMPFLGPTWMDDLNVCLAADTNQGIENKAAVAAGLLLEQCHQYHMEPNLRKGKTEIMFAFRGAGTREFRRRYYSSGQGLTVVHEQGTSQISVVSRYLHLGGILHHRDVDRVEVTRRLAIAHQAFTMHRKILYHNCKLTWEKRRELFNTLILSKLVYGLESWAMQSQAVRNQFHSGVMNLYRRLMKIPHDSHITDLTLLAQVGLPKPDDLLRSGRLRYFGTLHHCGSAANWGLLAEDHEWISLLHDDFRWLWEQLCNATDLPDPVQHYPAWKDLITFHASYWKKLVKRGIAHAIAQRQNYAIALDLHQNVGKILYDHQWVTSLPCDAKKATPSAHFGCMLCRKRQLTHAGESVHLFKCHGRLTPARFLFDETHCPACLREFHTRAKVLAHLRTVHQCRRQLIGQRMRCQPQPGVGSSIDRELEERLDRAQPFLQACGPKLCPPQQIDFEAHDDGLLEDLYLALLDANEEGNLERIVRNEIHKRPISWTMCRHTLRHFHDIFSPQDAEVLPFSFDDVARCVSKLAEPEQWPFLHDTCTRAGRHLSADISVWEDWFADIACSPPCEWQTLKPQPRSLSRHRIILHAYAGRRRRGDIEWYIDEIAKCHHEVVIHVASVDVIIDAVYGDITKEATRNYWVGHILQGFVIGFLAGPPCNTWSRARHHIIAGTHGPRVVRTPDAPWGKDSLRLRELQQVSIGTLLLGFAFQCITALALRSGTGFVEHPRDPEQDHIVSIWRLPVLRAILQLPNVRLLHLAQGLYGAPSAKPTTLLVLGMPGLEITLHAHRVTRELPQGASVGKNELGQFNTAPLKEYPPSMCRALAMALCSEAISMECDGSDVPVGLIERCTAMSNQLFGHFIGHDDG